MTLCLFLKKNHMFFFFFLLVNPDKDQRRTWKWQISLLMKHLVVGQRLKTPNFSAFHWSPRGSLVSIGQHFVATRVVPLPKSTETSLITESYPILTILKCAVKSFSKKI